MDLTLVSRVLRAEIIPLRIPYLLAISDVHPAAIAGADDTADNIRQTNGFNVASTLIRNYAAYREARNNYRTVLDWGGRHSRARNAEADYLALACEVFPTFDIDVTPLTKRLRELTPHGT
ncbi:MAG: hypothetical protein GEV04_18145 [Actinophytocola sp.]|nr:hypothetical protein [Actinophytocola sp.]